MPGSLRGKCRIMQAGDLRVKQENEEQEFLSLDLKFDYRQDLAFEDVWVNFAPKLRRLVRLLEPKESSKSSGFIFRAKAAIPSSVIKF